MKIRSKLTLTLFLLISALISIFSYSVFYQVQGRVLAHAKNDLLDHLEHEWEHLPRWQQALGNGEPHQKGVHYKIYKGSKLLVSTFPPGVPEILPPGIHERFVTVQLDKQMDGDHYRLVGTADLQQSYDYLRLLGRLLIAGCLCVVGLLAPASWFIAGWGLAPFRRLALETAKIEATDLSFRFPRGRPDDEYGKLLATINLLLTRLDRAFGELNLFAAKASHELKTPLAAIIGQAEKQLRRKDSDREVKETLNKILAQASRLSHVTEQLLELAEMDSKKSQATPTQIDAGDLMREIGKTYGQQAAALHKTIELDLCGPTFVAADSGILATSLGNLLENALKFGKCKIVLACRIELGRVVLSVDDDGNGLRAGQETRMVRPFEKSRALSDGTLNPGAGLGLAIVKSGVDSLKGQLKFAQSQLGGLSASIVLTAAV